MSTGLNPYVPFYSLSILMPSMIYFKHPYLASILGQKLSLETHNLFQTLSIFLSSFTKFGKLSECMYWNISR